MDYVLFGMGYGATLMLLGWALRTFGPERKYKNIDTEDVDLVVEQHRWVRFIQGLGGVIAIAGVSLVVFTFIVMLVNPDDETGGLTAMVVWGFLIVAIVTWCWFYISRYGLVGIWSRENGYGFRGSAGANSQSSLTTRSDNRVVPKPRINESEADSEPALKEPTPTEDQSEAEPQPIVEVEDPELLAEDVEEAGETELAPSSDTEAEPADPDTGDESGPGYDFGDGTDTTVPSEVGGRTEAIRRLRERQSRTGNSKS